MINFRSSLAANNTEDLMGVNSPLHESSPRPEVRVIAPSHRPSSVLATNSSTGNQSSRKSVSILLPEHIIG